MRKSKTFYFVVLANHEADDSYWDSGVCFSDIEVARKFRGFLIGRVIGFVMHNTNVKLKDEITVFAAQEVRIVESDDNHGFTVYDKFEDAKREIEEEYGRKMPYSEGAKVQSVVDRHSCNYVVGMFANEKKAKQYIEEQGKYGELTAGYCLEGEAWK